VTVDFLLIGAQKAGTTSLFEYMRRHPDVHMPPEKELSFFDRKYDRGPDWYMTTALRKAPAGATCGEASVGYMAGAPVGELPDTDRWNEAAAARYKKPYEEIIPRRISQLLPGVKLICILRDPVERAYSHYLMAVLNQLERRPFDETVASLMEPEALKRSRVVPSDTNSYIVFGEYARILTGFMRVFRREQLLVVFSSDLALRPADTLASIFTFIDVTDGVTPANVGVHYRTAAVQQRIKGVDMHTWQAFVARQHLARRVWHAMPAGVRARLDRTYKLASFRVAVWNARRGVRHEEISPTTRELLADHFGHEIPELCKIIGRDVPWLA
jgi:Sulfotransferase domain